MRNLYNCKEYRILAEHEDDSSFIKEYEHKKRQIFAPHTNTQSSTAPYTGKVLDRQKMPLA